MQSEAVIYLMVGCLTLFALVIMFGKPIKAVIMLVFRSIIGAAAIFAADFLLSPIGLSVGINLFTAFVTGILGIPGFIMLYALTLILQ